ncbi:MAG: hypothetical protein AAB685_00125 [Patescibacteria group bacterium]
MTAEVSGTLLSRRNFLRFVPPSLAAVAALGLDPRPPTTPISFQFAGLDRPLNSEDLDTFEKERKDYLVREGEINPLLRTTEFLIGESAWKTWQAGNGPNGETYVDFLRRHVAEMNRIMALTRPDSGINEMRIEPLVLIVDDQFLQKADLGVRQFTSGEAYGRLPFDFGYDPEKSAYWHFPFDDGLPHEFVHYTYYLYPHLFDYFTRGPNWSRDYLNLNNIPSSQDGITNAIGIWNEREMNKQFKTTMLMNAFRSRGGAQSLSYLAEPEELGIRRVCLSPSLRPRSVGQVVYYSREMFAHDHAPAYNIFAPGIETAKLFLPIFSGGDYYNPEYSFLPEGVDLPVQEGQVIIPSRLIRGGIGDGNYIPKTFVVTFDNSQKYPPIGFNSWQLIYWHWREQNQNGEQFLGMDGGAHPVTLRLDEFETPS